MIGHPNKQRYRDYCFLYINTGHSSIIVLLQEFCTNLFYLFDDWSQGFLVQDRWISHLKNTCSTRFDLYSLFQYLESWAAPGVVPDSNLVNLCIIVSIFGIFDLSLRPALITQGLPRLMERELGSCICPSFIDLSR